MQKYLKYVLFCLLSGWMLSLPLVSPAHALSPTEAPPPSRPQPGSRYHLVAIQYSQPRQMSMGMGKQSFSEAVEIQLTGVFVNGVSVQPTVYLNGFKTARTHIKPNTDSLTAWLYGVSLQTLRRAAIAQGGWSLEYQLPGGQHRLRVSPTGRLKDLGKRPVILSSTR